MDSQRHVNNNLIDKGEIDIKWIPHISDLLNLHTEVLKINDRDRHTSHLWLEWFDNKKF